MEAPKIRVLVVDDYTRWCRFVCSMLEKRPEFQVVGEVSDGLEAVQKAQELQPNLILLDIGLPSLSGIEAARRIRKCSPKSKIIFVSQEYSADVVQVALETGANGYVGKTDALHELLMAVNTVVRGEIFLGSRFAGHNFTEIAGRHEAGFYSDDRFLLDNLARFVGTALRSGNAAIVAATESHGDSLFLRLQAHGLDVGAAMEQGRYIAADANDTLSMFMVNGMPDPIRFEKAFGSLILTAARAATRPRPRVAIFGECVHLLWAQGNAEAAIQMEKLGNQLTKRYDVDILCGYFIGRVEGGMEPHIYQQICAEHSAVYSR